MIHLGNQPAGSTLYIPFTTYGKTNGESITLTGLATGDILIYKNGSVTQRASAAGFTLLDTDGIDFDGVTGVHGFSVDLADNTDAGFYAVGSFYWVVVSAITVDGQTVNFIAATFRIVAAEAVAGTPVADVAAISGDATAANNAESFFDGTGYAGTGNVIPQVTGVTGDVAGKVLGGGAAIITGVGVSANCTQISGDTTAADNAEAFFDGTGYAGTNNVIPLVTVCTTVTNQLTGGAIADAVWDEVVDGSTTGRQSIRLLNSALGGILSGAATATISIRDLADSKDRVIASVDASGNRSALTLDLT